MFARMGSILSDVNFANPARGQPLVDIAPPDYDRARRHFNARKPPVFHVTENGAARLA